MTYRSVIVRNRSLSYSFREDVEGERLGYIRKIGSGTTVEIKNSSSESLLKRKSFVSDVAREDRNCNPQQMGNRINVLLYSHGGQDLIGQK